MRRSVQLALALVGGATAAVVALSVVALSVVALSGCTSADRETVATIRVGLAIPSYVHGVAWVAQDRGLFAAHGLQTEITVMGGSSATMRALIGDAIDVGIGGGDAVIRANRAGADLVIIAGLVNRFYHRVVTRHDIDSIPELAGRTVGLPFLGGPQEMTVRHVLRRAGLDPDEVTLANLGKDFNALAALTRGDIDATTTDAPPSVVAALGLHVVADVPSWDVSFPYAVVAVRRPYLEQHHGELKAFLTGLITAIAYYRDATNQSDCLELLARHLPVDRAQDSAHERYRASGPMLLSHPPLPHLDSIRELIRELDAEGSVTIDTLVDQSVLDEVLDEHRF